MKTEIGLDRGALLAAVTAFSFWGIMPIYFKQMDQVPALEIVAHRVVWALPILLILLAGRRQLSVIWNVITHWATLRWMIVSALLILLNWLLFVWAINNGQILAASLGYFLNPLLNILAGTLFLGERFSKAQWAAVAIAACGVALLSMGATATLWISLTLASSFAIYGLVRKLAPVEALPGLMVEMILLAPFAILGAVYLSNMPDSGWGSDMRTNWYMIGGGITAIFPLLLFSIAARRLPYSIVGFTQYLAPTGQFLVGIFIYDEPLSTLRGATFAIIWLALAIFSWDLLRQMRGEKPALPA